MTIKDLLDKGLGDKIIQSASARIEEINELNAQIIDGYGNMEIGKNLLYRFRNFSPNSKGDLLVLADKILEITGQEPFFVKTYGDALFDAVENMVVSNPVFPMFLNETITLKEKDFLFDRYFAERFGSLVALSVFANYTTIPHAEKEQKLQDAFYHISKSLKTYAENYQAPEDFIKGFYKTLNQKRFTFIPIYGKPTHDLLVNFSLKDETKSELIRANKDYLNFIAPKELKELIKRYIGSNSEKSLKSLLEILDEEKLIKTAKETLIQENFTNKDYVEQFFERTKLKEEPVGAVSYTHLTLPTIA
jgi:hypothetical protein